MVGFGNMRVLKGRPVATLTITGTPSPSGIIGTPYSFTPTLAGGYAPRHCTITGTLPNGLNFNTTTGAITGTPTTAQTMSGLVITVIDAAGTQAQLGPFSIAIASVGSFITPGSTAFRSWAIILAGDPLLTPSGSPTDWGYNQRAIGQWTTPMWDLVTGTYYAGVQAGKAPTLATALAGNLSGIAKVSFSANNGPWFDVTSPSAHPIYGNTAWLCPMRASDFPASGTVELRAIVYPVSGQPFCLQGRDAGGYGASVLETNAGPVTALNPTGSSIDARTIQPAPEGANMSFVYDSWSMILNVDKTGVSLPHLVYYIAPPGGGSDSNNGLTNATPFATWGHAFDVAEAASGGAGSDIGFTRFRWIAGTGHSLPGFPNGDVTHVTGGQSKLYKAQAGQVVFEPDPAAAAGSVGVSVQPFYPVRIEKMAVIGKNGDPLPITGGTFIANCDFTGSPSRNTNYMSLRVENVAFDGGPGIITVGELGDLIITNGGSGYTSAPTPVQAGATPGTSPVLISGGQVTGYNNLVGTNGSGWTQGGAVTFTGGGGSGATATAVVTYQGQPSAPAPINAIQGTWGHLQVINASFTRVSATGINWNQTLALNLVIHDIGSQSDVCGGGKAIINVLAYNIADDPHGNHLDGSQIFFARNGMVIDGFVTDTGYAGQGIFGDVSASFSDIYAVNNKVKVVNPFPGTLAFSALASSGIRNFYALNTYANGAGGPPPYASGCVDNRVAFFDQTGIGTCGINWEVDYIPGVTVIYPYTPAEPQASSTTPQSQYQGLTSSLVNCLDLENTTSVFLLNKDNTTGTLTYNSGGVVRVALLYNSVNYALRDFSQAVMAMRNTGLPSGSPQINSRRPVWSATGFNGRPCMTFNGDNSGGAGACVSTAMGSAVPSGIATNSTPFEIWFCGNNTTDNDPNPTIANNTNRLYFYNAGTSGAGVVFLARVFASSSHQFIVGCGQQASGGGGGVAVTQDTGTGGFNCAGVFFCRIQFKGDRISSTYWNAANPSGFSPPDKVFSAVDPTKPLLFHGMLPGNSQTLGSNSVIQTGFNDCPKFDMNSMFVSTALSAPDAAAIVSAMHTRVGF